MWCRPAAPRSPPCWACGTPCAPTRSCTGAAWPSSGPSWPAARPTRSPSQGQARLDRRHPGRLGLADEQPRRLYQDDLDPDNRDRMAS
jgi:hypothetical protein